MSQKAIVKGHTGQDGADLSKRLLHKNCQVFGTFRRIVPTNVWRIEDLGWQAITTLEALCDRMVVADLKRNGCGIPF